MNDKLDLFLAAEVDAKGEVYLKRFGMNFEIKGLTDEELKSLREQATYGTGKEQKLNDSEFFSLIISSAVTAPNLNDPKVVKKYGAKDGADVIGKAFLAGEVTKLRDAILALSGFDEEESVEEAKN